MPDDRPRPIRWTLLLVIVGVVAVLSAACLGGLYFAVGRAVDDLFDPHDSFTDGLVVPDDFDMREPLEVLSREPEIADPIGDSLLTVSADDGAPTRTVEVALAQLSALDRPAAERTFDRLAMDPRWRVGVEDGRTFAYRRLREEPGGALVDSLNGFYGRTDPWCSVRIVLGLGGPVYADVFVPTESTPVAGTIPLELTPSDNDGQLVSYLVARGPHVTLEVFEEGPTEDRPLTRAAIELVRRTLDDVSAIPPYGHGAPTLELARGMQGGIYFLRARINPGPLRGRVYLRAYEAVRERELSADTLRDRTTQAFVGTDDLDALYTYSTEVMIYEGDWGDHYPARFEVWFEPSDGGDARKLVEDTFRIEGWMR
ncbi:MAG: hypothetical protein AB7P00_30660 [Sandaracinaceae bacterium]